VIKLKHLGKEKRSYILEQRSKQNELKHSFQTEETKRYFYNNTNYIPLQKFNL